jgi:hypothetical protein
VLGVVGFPILRHGYAVYPAGRQLSVVARAFLDYLLEREEPAPAKAGKKKSELERIKHLIASNGDALSRRTRGADSRMRQTQLLPCVAVQA